MFEGGRSADNPSVWSDERLLGYAPMDHVHEAFYRAALRLLAADELDAPAAIEALESHLIEHFGLEEKWMRDSGFPAAACHVDEHAAVLTSVEQVRHALAQGHAGAELLHRLAQQLLAWFPSHADYMDSALAAWMCRRLHGGQPVVVKRSRLRHPE